MKKEVKVGLLGLIGMVFLYFGFNFLKGSDFFSKVNEYQVKYKEVAGLEVSNPVTFNGVNVGRVIKLEPNFKTGEVVVSLSINKDLILNNNTEAILADNGLISGKMIKLSLKPGKELTEGGYLKGHKEGGLIDNMSGKIDPTLSNINNLTLSLNKVVHDFDNTGQALKLLIASANSSTVGVNGLIANNSKSIAQVTSNAAELTRNLNTLSNNLDAQIKPILSKANSVTDSLKALELSKTVLALNNSIGSIQSILNDVNNGKGTLGKLKGDDSLYINIDRTAASLNMLLADMKANPKRYVHFSLFGKKTK